VIFKEFVEQNDESKEQDDDEQTHQTGNKYSEAHTRCCSVFDICSVGVACQHCQNVP
jgi:hypothetical protein